MLSLRALCRLFIAFCVLAQNAAATWSIILVNIKTGEIAIGCATCLTGLDLTYAVPVLVVGKGAAAAQSFLDTSGQNRAYIWTELMRGTKPDIILANLALRDPGHQTRQYGFVTAGGDTLGFTGTGAGAWAGHLTGQLGDVAYAIQGNVLTGQNVLKAAEVALWTTPGDLPTRLMAAMQAARAFGGDGRCSCNRGPTGCGSPPPSFQKSAHIGFMIAARNGDQDGTCSASVGCANGSYYMRLNVPGQSFGAPDPVAQLQSLFDAWATLQHGRPDHHRSTVELPTAVLPGDGLTSIEARVVLRDRDGRRITQGGATVTPTLDPGNTAQLTLGAVRDNGDGSYAIPITAGTTLGTARFSVRVDDGQGGRLLTRVPEIEVNADRLWASRAELSARSGGSVDFVLNFSPAAAGRVFVLLASDRGTTPGIVIYFFPPLTLWLNPGPVFQATLLAAFTLTAPELVGVFPQSGRATTRFTFPPGAFGLPQDSDLHFAWALIDPVTHTSNAVKVRLVR